MRKKYNQSLFFKFGSLWPSLPKHLWAHPTDRQKSPWKAHGKPPLPKELPKASLGPSHYAPLSVKACVLTGKYSPFTGGLCLSILVGANNNLLVLFNMLDQCIFLILVSKKWLLAEWKIWPGCNPDSAPIVHPQLRPCTAVQLKGLHWNSSSHRSQNGKNQLREWHEQEFQRQENLSPLSYPLVRCSGWKI